MNTTEILSSYIKKLGHPLKEIRERALKLLIAKLELGWQLDDELAGTRHLLESLLAWFHVEQPSNQQEALYLLLKIIKTQSGTYIVKEYGLKKLLSELNKLSDKLDPHAAELYDDVIDTLRFLNSVQSQESLSVPHLNIPSGTSSKTCDGIKILLFPWANMGTSDTKTILLIEDALNLLKSTRRCCRFIRDVFLRDFPAEIFLNRPSIIQYLLAILERGNGGKLSEPLNVLLCVTRALTSRLKQLYCLDLIHEADKLHITKGQESEDKVNTELEEIVSDVRQATGFRSKEDGLQALRQLPVPIFALDALQTILSAMARSVLLTDSSGKNDGLNLNELNICISLVESLIGLLLDCVNASFWTMDHNTKTYRDIAHKSCMVMRMFGDLLRKYRSSYTSALDRHAHRLAWLRLLPSARRLLQWTARSALAPAALVTALQSARLDPALDMFYEGVAGEVGDCLMATETASNKEYKSKYRELKKLFSAMGDAVTFMKDKDSIGLTKKVLTCIKNSLPVLELHLNEGYLKDVGEILLKRLKDWELNDKEWNDARTTALALMAHSNEFVQSRFYAMMAEVVKMVFVDEDGDHLENEKCLMQFCDVGILTEICCHGLNSESSEVSTSAEQIMLYLLRGRMLLSEKCWWRLLATLMPVFPLLHAYAAHDTVLGQAICKSLEPDIAECMGVSRAEALAGLARLLFVGCPPVQMDAALCLCCLLGEYSGAGHSVLCCLLGEYSGAGHSVLCCLLVELDIAECMGVSRAEALAGLARLLFVGCPPVQMDAALCLCCLLDRRSGGSSVGAVVAQSGKRPLLKQEMRVRILALTCTNEFF
ncbi:unnamed protein product [Plutella xylostella]|uniref:(diamondback moth) hypothetical protein n=1 Tax=Plutella xylostella TaxID=51655 RepID=A0A8S4D8D9_PLUXY|nr:unnamed protein product [Plutella xylostella]